jgi:hypothetical protein
MVLVEDGSIGTEHAVRHTTTGTIVGTNVESLKQLNFCKVQATAAYQIYLVFIPL